MSPTPHDQPSYPPPARRRAHGEALHPQHAGRTSSHRKGDVENLVSPEFLLWVFRQWWKIGIPVGLLLAVVAGAAVIHFHIPKYRASALLMIEETSPFVAFNQREIGRSSQRYVETQLEMIRSPVVLEPVLSRSEIAALPGLAGVADRLEYLQQGLDVQRVGRSELYNISFTSRSAEEAASVVNAAIAEYLNIHSGDEFHRSQRVIDLLEEERRRRGLEVERLRQRVIDIAKDVTGRDPFGGTVTDVQRALNPVSSLFQSLTEVDVEHEVMRAELESLLSAAPAAGSTLESDVLELDLENQPEIRERQSQIRALELRMGEMKGYFKEEQLESNAIYQQLAGEFQQRQAELAEAKEQLRTVMIERNREQRSQQREQQVAAINHQLKMIEARKELLSQRFVDRVNEMQSGGARSVELEFAQAELAREEKVFEMIAARKLALQTELRAPARVQLTRRADVPSRPAQPVPYKLLLVFCSAALVAPFGLAVAREAMVRRISDLEQFSKETGLRVLGEISTLPVRSVAVNPRLLVGGLRRNGYIFAESINSLRTNLAVAEDLRGHQVIAVTSSATGEGKSSIVTSLAMSIANATEVPTLVIDGDMRSPDVASLLKTRSQPGLFEVLSRKSKLADAIHRVGETNLYVLPAGRATRSPHRIVSMADVEQVLAKLRERFSTIIIDTPPILGASESLVLAKAADMALFCSLCDVSKAKQVRYAIERLEHAGVNVAGAVLSGISAKQYAYVYGYYAQRTELDG